LLLLLRVPLNASIKRTHAVSTVTYCSKTDREFPSVIVMF